MKWKKEKQKEYERKKGTQKWNQELMLIDSSVRETKSFRSFAATKATGHETVQRSATSGQFWVAYFVQSIERGLVISHWPSLLDRDQVQISKTGSQMPNEHDGCEVAVNIAFFYLLVIPANIRWLNGSSEAIVEGDHIAAHRRSYTLVDS